MSSKMRFTEPNNNETSKLVKAPASDESDCYSDSNCEEFDFESSDLEELDKETMIKAEPRLSNHLSDSDTEFHEASAANFNGSANSPMHSEAQRSSTPFSENGRVVGSDLCETVNSSLIANTATTRSSIGNPSDLVSQESENDETDDTHKHAKHNSQDYVYADDYDEEDKAFVNLLGRANEIVGWAHYSHSINSPKSPFSVWLINMN